MVFFQAFALLLLPFLLGLHWMLAFFQALSFLLPPFLLFFFSCSLLFDTCFASRLLGWPSFRPFAAFHKFFSSILWRFVQLLLVANSSLFQNGHSLRRCLFFHYIHYIHYMQCIQCIQCKHCIHDIHDIHGIHDIHNIHDIHEIHDIH